MLSTTTSAATVRSTLRQQHHFYRSHRPPLARAPAIARTYRRQVRHWLLRASEPRASHWVANVGEERGVFTR
jgi:hypothetical protein